MLSEDRNWLGGCDVVAGIQSSSKGASKCSAMISLRRESRYRPHICAIMARAYFKRCCVPMMLLRKALSFRMVGGHFIAAEPATRVCSFFFGTRNLACPQSRQTVNFGNAQTMGLLRPSNPER